MLLRGLCNAQALLQKLASLRKGLQLTGVLRQVQRQLARPRATPAPQSRRAAAETASGPARQCSSGKQISRHEKNRQQKTGEKSDDFATAAAAAPRCQQRANGPKAPAALGTPAQELRALRPASAANVVNGPAAPSIKQGQHIV